MNVFPFNCIDKVTTAAVLRRYGESFVKPAAVDTENSIIVKEKGV